MYLSAFPWKHGASFFHLCTLLKVWQDPQVRLDPDEKTELLISRTARCFRPCLVMKTGLAFEWISLTCDDQISARNVKCYYGVIELSFMEWLLENSNRQRVRWATLQTLQIFVFLKKDFSSLCLRELFGVHKIFLHKWCQPLWHEFTQELSLHFSFPFVDLL